MNTRRVLKKITLNKNKNGTYYGEFEEGDKVRVAFLGKKRVEDKHFYSPLVLERTYLASIDLVGDDKAFVEQLITVPENHQGLESPDVVYRCQMLDNGRLVLQEEGELQEKDEYSRLVLPSKIVSRFAYRIFHNSQVLVSFGHDDNGFFIKQWLTNHPVEIKSGLLKFISKESTNPKAPYNAKYFVSEDTYLPVKLWPRTIQILGIKTLTEQACIDATITIDDEKQQTTTIPSCDPELLLEKHNVPRANLLFLGVDTTSNGKDIYQFETELIDGISLAVSAWPFELEYIMDDTALLQKGQCIPVHLSYQISPAGWCNFQLPIALKNHYSETFLCVTMKEVGNESVALLETTESPHDRILVPRSALVKQGIYAINAGVALHVEMTRDGKFDPWQIVEMGKEVFNGIEEGLSYQDTCTVLMPWSSYNNRPDYLLKLTRDRQNYAFTNHCITAVSTKYAELLLLIPVSLLAGNGFRTLAPDDSLQVEFKKIHFPVFDTNSVPILCADILLSEEPPPTFVDDTAYAMANFIEKVPPRNTEDRYRFAIVDSEDTVEFIDRSGQLSHIAEPSKYRYQICIIQYPTGLYVKELISASVK